MLLVLHDALHRVGLAPCSPRSVRRDLHESLCERLFSVAPATGETGTATITLTVEDGEKTAQASFDMVAQYSACSREPSSRGLEEI